jgi:hypothetical protein
MTKGPESIRNALAALSPKFLAKMAAVLKAAVRDNPDAALDAFRDAARENFRTDPRAAETFVACAEILKSELAKSKL